MTRADKSHVADALRATTKWQRARPHLRAEAPRLIAALRRQRAVAIACEDRSPYDDAAMERGFQIAESVLR